jgi:hypothetical protein
MAMAVILRSRPTTIMEDMSNVYEIPNWQLFNFGFDMLPNITNNGLSTNRSRER